MHLIYFHSKIELQQWCINRDFLKYQEEMLTRRQFIKTIETSSESILDKEKGGIREMFDDQAYQK